MAQFSIAARVKRVVRPRGLRIHRGAAGQSERGDLAVIIAVLAAVLLVLIPLAAYAASTNFLPLSQGNQDYQAALAAAESGVANFVNQVNTNPNTSPALKTTTWIQVAGAPKEYYYYTATFDSRNSTYYVTSTGISLHGKQTYTRTVQETIIPSSYNTFELFYNTFQQSPSMQSLTNCSSPCVWNINNLPPGQTSAGTFYSGGNYYSNTVPKAPSGVTLESGGQADGVESFCSPNAWYKTTGTGGCGNTASPIKVIPPITFPQSTTVLKALSTAAQSGGCYYQGLTMITMETASSSSASVPTYAVYSPGTTNASPACGGSGVQSWPGAVTVLNATDFTQGVVYVDNFTNSQNATYSAAQCPVYVSPNIPPYLYGGNPCVGNLLIGGTAGSQVTLGAANDVILVNNLVYADCSATSIGPSTNPDITGLAAGADLAVAGDAWGTLPLLAGSTSSNFSTSSCYSVVASGQVSSVGQSDAFVMGSLFALGGSVIPLFDSSGCGGTAFPQIDFYGNIVAGSAGLNGIPSSSYGCTGAHFHNSLEYDNRFLSLIPPNFPFQLATFSGAATWKEVANPSGLPALP